MVKVKQLLSVVLAGGLVLGMTACGDNENDAAPAEGEAQASENNTENAEPEVEEVDEDEIVMNASRAYLNTLPEGNYMMSADDVYEALDEVVVLDIRRADDFSEEAIAGAVNIPMGELGTSFDDIPEDEKIVVVCYSGQTASQSAAVLRMAGFDTYIATGGMNGWNAAELPVE